MTGTGSTNGPPPEARKLARERWRLLHQLERWLEGPMVALGFVWLVLLIVELTQGLNRHLERLSTAIWVVFLFDFLLRLGLAPRKGVYLRHNWLTALALLAPALRVLRVARALRLLRVSATARGARLLKVVASLNRGMRALGRSMGRRGLGYVLALTLIVVLVGAAGMFAFERSLPRGGGLENYWDALWWTAMLLTTLGSEYWPHTPEGRVLGFLLSGYAIAVVGYVTAALASFFVGRDAESQQGEVASAAAIEALRAEVAGLREEIRALSARGR